MTARTSSERSDPNAKGRGQATLVHKGGARGRSESLAFSADERRTEHGEARLSAARDCLRPDPRNAKIHPPRQLDELRQAFRRFGQQKPVVVDRAGNVLAGHGWLEALRLEGAAEAWVTISSLDEIRAQAFRISDNRTAELGDWDPALLAEALETLGQLEPELARSVGFDERELAELLADVERASAHVDGAVARSTNGSASHERTEAPPLAGSDRPRDWANELMQDRPPMLAQGDAVSRTGDVWHVALKLGRTSLFNQLAGIRFESG